MPKPWPSACTGSSRTARSQPSTTAATPRAPAGRGAPPLLGVAGSAWKAEAMALYLHGLFPDREVAAFHYRGYAPSTGRPSAQALLADSVLVFDRLQQAHASGRGVVAVGFSIGAGVAAHLARHRPVAGLGLRPPSAPLGARAPGCRGRVPPRRRGGGPPGPAPARGRAGPGHALRLIGGPGPGPLLVG